MSPITLKTLSALRVLIGASCLLVPRHAGMLFGIPLAPGPEGVLLGRMTGVRDIVLGAYLWKTVRGWEEVAKGDAGADGSRAPLLFNNKASSGVNTTAPTIKKGASTAPALPRDISPQSPVLPTGLEHGRGLGGGDGYASLASLQLAERESALRAAVWLGLVVDTIDAGSVIVGSLQGSPLSDLAKVTVGAGAVVFALIAGQHLVAHRRD
ncbi:uncharacterized protein PV07_07478 [Cladophialophora immunda]|uniref:Uncharacterized protein n=1 Tax=Cladophialophora immunda TaxID=569365 RepID=A0A0D2CBI7_9EURO|nr:uncharacterized protein PV07_07478 [Cladophialophora immunda]KIW27770.1 hypothetical protein PV07_07478 [Cladophialophora immunda]